MKKLVCILLVAVMALSTVSALALGLTRLNTGMHAWVYTQNGGKLNVREAGSAKAKVTYRLPINSEVVALGDSKDGFVWVEFKFNGKFANGYVSLDFLTLNQPAKVDMTGAEIYVENATPEKAPETVTSMDFRSYKPVTDRLLVIQAKPARPGGFVNFRWAPSQEAQVIAKLVPGIELQVITEGKNWYQAMSPDGYVGFIAKNYTEIVFDEPLVLEETAEQPAQ